MSNPLRETFSGTGVLLRGFGMVLRRPRLFLLGAIPPLITSILFVIILTVFLLNVDTLAAWLTPFAQGWDDTWRTATRVAVSLALTAVLLLVMVVGFTGLTLALGFPLYDKIAEAVEDELGDAPPAPDEPLVRSVARALRQAFSIIALTLLVTVPLFFAGFIPLIGQSVIPVIAALFGGWMLTIELVGTAFDRRGLIRLRDRRRHMGTRRLHVLGFAVPTYLLLSIPFVAVVVFPAATAGGTILARNLLPAAPPAPPAPAPHIEGGPPQWPGPA
ncbi:CysZ protein [Murinocardiopsis flavida]|uniref:CysZ protein n=1 Tax=Murinocardiopsis flavida TaxID=645275 RepID=A0A2P8DEG0_9ACTN|nr:EI24 domain-containing protein [Murinocardiopsis flavida]PSK95595.1 CysZ protein [Murinocardiopsis flavida]